MPFVLRLVGVVALVLLAAPPAGAQVDPDTLQLPALIQAAREAARRDRNAEAARLFGIALERDPSLRGELLPDFADQLTFSDQAKEAVPLYRELLASDPPPNIETNRHLRRQLALALSWSGQLGPSLEGYEALLEDDPQDRDARVGRARVLSWMGRLGPAGKEYSRALSNWPGDMEARRDLARVQVWRGRHRGGTALLESFLEDYPGDREARLLLAQTFLWMGRPDRAVPVVAELDRDVPPGSDLRNRLDGFIRELEEARTPVTRSQARVSSQSDHLTIRGIRGEQVVRLNQGVGELGVFYEGLEFEPRTAPGSGPRTIAEHRPGVLGRYRFGDRVQLSGLLQGDFIRTPAGAEDHSLATFNAFLTLWPGDEIRLDLGSRRETLDNERSLLQGITARFVSASMDWTPDEKTRATVRTDLGAYSDENSRRWVELELARQLWSAPNIIVGARGAHFAFDQLLTHGYFNPKKYRGIVAWSHGWGELGKRIWWDYDLSYGREFLDPGDEKPIWSAGGSLSRPVLEELDFKASYQYFSSRHFSSSGFERGTWFLSLDYSW